MPDLLTCDTDVEVLGNHSILTFWSQWFINNGLFVMPGTVGE